MRNKFKTAFSVLATKKSMGGWILFFLSWILWANQYWDNLRSLGRKLKHMGSLISVLAVHQHIVPYVIFIAGCLWIGIASFLSIREARLIKVTFEKSDKLTVRIVNRNPDKEARLRRLRIFGIKGGKEVELTISDNASSGNKMHESFPCVLPPQGGTNIETLINLPTFHAYGNTGYLAEVELEDGRTVRSQTVSPPITST